MQNEKIEKEDFEIEKEIESIKIIVDVVLVVGLIIIKSDCVSSRVSSIFAFVCFTFFLVVDVWMHEILIVETIDLDGCVVTSAYNVANGHCGGHVFVGEHTGDGRWLFSALFLYQCVAFQCDDTLYVASIQSFLVEFLTQFECDVRVLECGRCGQSVRIVWVFLQFDGRCHTSTDLTKHETDACLDENEMESENKRINQIFSYFH